MIRIAFYSAIVFARRFLSRDRASASIIIAASTIPLATGMAICIDYSRYLWIKAKFDQVADASALLAVSKSLLTKNQSDVSTRVKSFFAAQIEKTIADQSISLQELSINMTTVANGTRQVDIHYEATMPTFFMNLLGVATLPINGTRGAKNGLSPNIDFHILIDTSSSMGYPSTQEGLDILASTNSSRCLFACHVVNGLKGVKRDGTMGDLYSVARSYNLPLRLDAISEAIADLSKLASRASIENKSNYRMSVSEFNAKVNFKRLVDLTADYLEIAKSVEDLEPPLYWSTSCLTERCSPVDPGEQGTASSHAFEQMNKYMTAPGDGLKDSAPQSILLIITDGMRDEKRDVKGIPEIKFDPYWCDVIKNRGIRIGILYTVYSVDSLKYDPWSQTYILPRLHELEPALRSCASDALFIPVKTGENISEALQKLFNATMSVARLTK